MDEPVIHSCPDGTTWRISLIQSLRHDPSFDGNTYTFHVEREPEGVAGSGEGNAADAGGGGPEEAAAGGPGPAGAEPGEAGKEGSGPGGSGAEEAAPGGSGAEEAASGGSGAATTEPPEYFQVRVHVSPLYFGILTLEARRRLDEWVTNVVRRYLDRGHRDDALLKVTSNGAVRYGDEVLLPERGAA